MELMTVPDMLGGYVTVCRHVRDRGRLVEGRGGDTAEILGATIHMSHLGNALPQNVGRKVNLRLAAVEALSLVAGVSRPHLVRHAAPSYTSVLVSGDDEEDMDYGAYGPRIHGQLEPVLAQLRGAPETRQAVVQIWRPRDLTHTGDKPCTLSLQFLLRDDMLHMVSTMRSQDVWLGLAYDLFMFTQLQRTLANRLDVATGSVTHHVGSLHAYRRDFEKIEELHPTTYARSYAEPPGVDASSYGETTCQDVARQLLDGQADNFTRAANPWYTRQLARLGLYESEGESADQRS